MDNSTTLSSSKRRKTSSPDNNDNSTLCLANMPHDHLTAIADYLPKTSRALFAVSLTAPSKSFRVSDWKGKLSEASKAIIKSSTIPLPCPTYKNNSKFRKKVTATEKRSKERLTKYYASSDWDLLDFDDIDKELNKKLTDDDIGAVLVCIDAKNKLKSLLLDCVDVVGHALEPLRESKLLEKVQFASNANEQLSTEVVAPILDGIIDTEGTSLRNVVLPQDWKGGKARNEQPLNGFLVKFNKLLISNSECEGETPRSCFTCFKSVCDGCNGADGYPVQTCGHCKINICDDCEFFPTCRVCDSTFCKVCAERDDVDVAKQCEHCYGEPICFGCVSPENENCEACLGVFYPKLRARNEELGNEIAGLCDENEAQKARHADEKGELCNEIDILRKENDELKKQLSEGLGILG